MNTGIKYNEVTGEIIMGITSSDRLGVELQAEEGFQILFDVDPDVDGSLFYIVEGSVLPRPPMDLVYPDSMHVDDTFKITGIPIGSEVYFPNGTAIVDDGEIEWDVTHTGIYQFSLFNFPYVAEEITLEVTPSLT